eukprot:Skav235055  [mRNA]  locus=scaffold3697:141662:143174:- [translate_table: standard]
MVGGAFLHFVLVELRPLIGAGISTLSIHRTMFQQAYRSSVPMICEADCNMQECIEQNSNLLQSAMTSFSRDFNSTLTCTRVWVFEEDKLGVTIFYYLLLTIWSLILLTCILMILVEMYKRRFSSLYSGAYLVFTLQLEHRRVATMEAARGNYTLLKSLVEREGDAYLLMQAIALPALAEQVQENSQSLPGLRGSNESMGGEKNESMGGEKNESMEEKNS